MKIFSLTILLISVLFSEVLSQVNTLNIYGPGGPLSPMKECGELFAAENNVTVNVTAGPVAQWLDKAKNDADLIFGGAEYMLTDFDLKNPGIVDKSTRKSLYIRAAGILVRKGNPKNINSLSDLTKDGIKIVDVNGAGQVGMWEDLAGSMGLIPGIQKNIDVSVSTSAEAIDIWKSRPEIDAWINYESWHYRMKDETDLVTFPEGKKIYRGTPIAVTLNSDDKDLARKFIDFLLTDKCHEVFQKWGWK